jgi:hypothetical protein
VTVGGGPLAYGATLRFEETTTGESFWVGVDSDGLIDYGTSQIPIAPGNYRIYYTKRSGGGWTTEPWNEQRPLTTINLATSQALALDVPRIYIGGTVTVGGGPLAYGATLRFEETTTGESFWVGVDSDGLINYGTSPVPIAPGNYRIYYTKRSGGGWTTEPWNEGRLLTTINLTTSQQLALDVPRVYIGGTVKVAGGALAYGATLRFEETTTGDSFLVGIDSDGLIDYGTSQIPIAPGNYRIYYTKRSGGGWSTEPWNEGRLLTTMNLTTSQQLALDVPRVYVGGTVKVAGGPLAYGATLRFEEVTTGGSFLVGIDSDGLIDYGTSQIPIAPGNYNIYYGKRSGGGWTTEPWNEMHLLSTVDLTTSKQLALDVPRRTLTGTVTVGGGALAYGATLRLENAFEDSDSFLIGVDSDGAIDYGTSPIPLAPGSYRTFYSKRSGGGWTTEPWNENRPLGCFTIP